MTWDNHEIIGDDPWDSSPPIFLPRPHPGPDPAPHDPDALAADYDWMSVPHESLYEMMHSGVNVQQAREVAESWLRISAMFDELGTEIDHAIEESADAWQGDAAEHARTSVGSLSEWTRTTSDDAANVGTCTEEQADNAQFTRSAMPPPTPRLPFPYPIPVSGGPPVMHPMAPAHTGSAPFTGDGFASARDITDDHIVLRGDDREEHRRAADLMAQYQRQSHEIYGTVPRFTDPDTGAKQHREREGDTSSPADGDPPVRSKPTPEPGGGTTVASAGAVPTGSGVATPAVGPPAGQGHVPVAARPGGGGTASISTPGTGSESAVGQVASRSPVSQAEMASGLHGRAMGTPMGMAGGAGQRGGGDAEHRYSGLLEDDDDLFGLPSKAAPPVIGEGQHDQE